MTDDYQVPLQSPLAQSLHHDLDTFEPVFYTAVYPDDPHEYSDGEMWAYGYMTGMELQHKNWNAFFDEPNSASVLRPIYLLGAEEITPEEEALSKTPTQREELSNQIPASVAWIYRFWQPYRRAVAERTIATSFQRENPQVGRNDPCPWKLKEVQEVLWGVNGAALNRQMRDGRVMTAIPIAEVTGDREVSASCAMADTQQK